MIRTKYICNYEDKKFSLEELEDRMKPHYKWFVLKYISNGWQAAKAYSEVFPNALWTTANVAACNLLKRPDIKQYIEYKKEDFEAICGVNKAKQIQEYAKIAYCSIAHLHDTWITLKDFEDIPLSQREAIESIETKTEQVMNSSKEMVEIKYVKIKLFDKIKALDKIDMLMGYRAAEKIKVENDNSMLLGTGNISAIRKAFGLDENK